MLDPLKPSLRLTQQKSIKIIINNANQEVCQDVQKTYSVLELHLQNFTSVPLFFKTGNFSILVFLVP